MNRLLALRPALRCLRAPPLPALTHQHPPIAASGAGRLRTLTPGSVSLQQRVKCTKSQSTQPGPATQCHKASTTTSTLSRDFWTSYETWMRAGVNTFRCLIGCTLGDFSAMWLLQAYTPELGIATIMSISMASGLTSSMLLETVLLRFGKDALGWVAAAETAFGMSIISMLTMEMAQNLVDYHLTGGAVQLDSPQFWLAALVSMGAGFLAPLPYNYRRLRKHGKACH